MAFEWVKTIDIAGIQRDRLDASRATLEKLGLAHKDLTRIGAVQVEDLREALLTSSSVHGLWTAKSDVDIICIADADLSEERAPAQLFMLERRFEIIVYSEQEVSRTLNDIAAVSRTEIIPALQVMRQWDRRQTIRQKYVERLVNGVTSQQLTPYIEHLRELAILWLYAAFDRARQFLICGLLAERSGEQRSHRAYGLRAVIHMMDMILSIHGLVYSNVKWIPLRWAKFRRGSYQQPLTRDLADHLDALWVRVLAAYLGAPSSPSGRELLELFSALATCLHLPEDLPLQGGAELIQRKGSIVPYCGNTSVAFDPRGNMVLSRTSGEEVPVLNQLEQFAGLTQDHAASILRASRARIVDLSLSAAPLQVSK